MDEQPKSRLNASDPSPYVIWAMIAGAVVLIAIAGWFILNR